jgi:hypothetical protein
MERERGWRGRVDGEGGREDGEGGRIKRKSDYL